MSTFMEEVFDNSEDATEKDLLEYDKYKEQNKENIIQKFLYLNEQGRTTVKRHAFEGVLPNLERRWRETDSAPLREELSKLRSTVCCPECHGSRLKADARNVFIGNDIRPALAHQTASAEHDKRRGLGIYEVEALSLLDCLRWFEQLQLSGAKQEVAERIIREIQSRLQFLNDVG